MASKGIDVGVLGIDFGTSNCCFSLWDNKNPIVPTLEDSLTIPSHITYFENEKEPLVGKIATMDMDEANIKDKGVLIEDIKSLLGRNYDDLEIGKFKGVWNFDIEKCNDTNGILVQVKIEDDKYEWKHVEVIASDIFSFILKKARDCSSFKSLERAVVTVPANFDNRQRMATVRAATNAGIEVLQLLNEPTAAAIDYGFSFNEEPEKQSNVLIFDYGGGTLDITILKISDGRFNVMGTCGDMYMGGRNLTRGIMQKLMKKYGKEESPKLFRKANNMKLKLSESISTKYRGMKITREEFEKHCHNEFKNCRKLLTKTLQRAKRNMSHGEDSEAPSLSKDDINVVLLVGGSSKVPQVKTIVKEYFNNKPKIREHDPLVCVARGAAIMGARYEGGEAVKEWPKMNNLAIEERVSLPIGIEIQGGIEPIFKAGTPIPCRKYGTYASSIRGSIVSSIRIYEGHSHWASKNKKLIDYNLNTAKPGDDTQEANKVEVYFEISKDGIVRVLSRSALEQKESSARQNKISASEALRDPSYSRLWTDDKTNEQFRKKLAELLDLEREAEEKFETTIASKIKEILDRFGTLSLREIDSLKGDIEKELREEIPNDFQCPINLTTMTDPVILVGDENTYEREAIERWFAEGKTTSPLTGVELSEKNRELIHNRSLRNRIEQFLRS
eukprot:gb/GECH01011719.1/.p1 GENE.gb/GECH01011719.1/~~gb/GECH01011719.1/.p1  ORF type:complete len:672 (+),score=118.51 gb/GECH01011719.1/:1-2016(+)